MISWHREARALPSLPSTTRHFCFKIRSQSCSTTALLLPSYPSAPPPPCTHPPTHPFNHHTQPPTHPSNHQTHPSTPPPTHLPPPRSRRPDLHRLHPGPAGLHPHRRLWLQRLPLAEVGLTGAVVGTTSGRGGAVSGWSVRRGGHQGLPLHAAKQQHHSTVAEGAAHAQSKEQQRLPLTPPPLPTIVPAPKPRSIPMPTPQGRPASLPVLAPTPT